MRACIFDMDGLLINSEDILTRCINQLLAKHGRPAITRSIRVQLMGVPHSTNSDVFHDWAQFPVPREHFARELRDEMQQHFPDCEPLPGAEHLLFNLSRARISSSAGDRLELALASSTQSDTYELKSSKPQTRALLDSFVADRRILGDDPRVGEGRGKPAPDIYLVALQSLNGDSSLASGEEAIRADECLVFEDSLAGVEAARRAGMRVVWVPHPDVVAEWQMRSDLMASGSDVSEGGDEWQLSELDDSWVERISGLNDFDYTKYGIYVPT